MRRAWVLFSLVAVLPITGICGEYLMNATGETVVGLRVVFSELVSITDFGDILMTVEPQGESIEFVFSGGELESWGGHWLNWQPDSAWISRYEWLREVAATIAIPTAAEGLVSPSASGVLFSDDFEDGRADAWSLPPGWRVEREADGNYILSGQGLWQWAILNRGYDWTDYTVRFRLKLITGGFQLNFRLNNRYGVHTRYIAGFREDDVYIDKEDPPYNFSCLAQKRNGIRFTLNVWHDVEIAADLGHLRIYIDGKLELECNDPDPLLQGSICLETLEYTPGSGKGSSRACIDDVEVRTSGQVVSGRQEAKVRSEAITKYGHIGADETWSGVIHVIGDINVGPGVTLTIEPGTTVLVAANRDGQNLCTYWLDMKQGIAPEGEGWEQHGIHPGEPFRDEGNHISIHVFGTLHAVGTPDEMITITSDSDNPTRYDWNFFTFRNGILSYAVVEYYRILGPGDDTVTSHNILRHIGECGVCFAQVHTTLVEHNTIYDAGHELIDIQPPGEVVIRNNHLGPNRQFTNPGGYLSSGEGIVIVSASPEIIDNTIEECHRGIFFLTPPAAPYSTLIPQLYNDNVFKNNGTNIEDHQGNRR